MASEVIDAASGVRRWPERAIFGLNGMASVGPMVTVESLVSDPKAKAQVGAQYGAIAIDLETVAVAETSQLNKVPWVVVRAILDPMEVTLPILSRVQGLQSLVRPARWKDLFGLLNNVRIAGRSLGEALNKLIAAQTSSGKK